MRILRYIVIHHSATTDSGTLSTDDIKRYHMQHNGWQDIGYHFVIEQVENDEVMIAGRPLYNPGAHAPGRNKDSIGVCLVGNFDTAPPSVRLWREAVRRVRDLTLVHNIPIANVIGHREATPGRTCPGRLFDIDAFRTALTAREES